VKTNRSQSSEKRELRSRPHSWKPRAPELEPEPCSRKEKLRSWSRSAGFMGGPRGPGSPTKKWSPMFMCATYACHCHFDKRGKFVCGRY